MTNNNDVVRIGPPDPERIADLVLALHAFAHMIVIGTSEETEAEGLLGTIVAARVVAHELEKRIVDTINSSGAARVEDTELVKIRKLVRYHLTHRIVDRDEANQMLDRLVAVVRGEHAPPTGEDLQQAIETWQEMREDLSRDVESFGPRDINPNLN